MKAVVTRFSVVLVVAFALPSLGCEVTCGENEEKTGTECVAKSLTQYTGKDSTVAVENWSSGGTVTINGVYGNIKVLPSNSDAFSVTFHPFSWRAHDARDAAVAEMETNLVQDVHADGNNVTISTSRNGGTTGLGSNIDVFLPQGFDAKLTVYNDANGPVNPGDIRVEFVGTSPDVSLINDKLGNCFLQGAPTVVNTKLDCDGTATVLDVSDNVNIRTTGLETDTAITLRLAGISDTATGGTIESEDGDISLTLPAQGNYAVQGFSPEGGNVDFGSTSCPVDDTNGASSKTMTCGSGGPLYKVTAGFDSVGDSNIFTSYK